MVSVHARGTFKGTFGYFEQVLNPLKLGELDRYGKMGVELLRAATPKDTGKTADSWSYEVIRSGKDNDKVTLAWNNSNINNGVNIAIILQYGHATGNGYYVQGIDYINPTLAPLFDELAEKTWKEVCSV